jgi:NlpC/P60 family putative phage cell wall peptidase
MATEIVEAARGWIRTPYQHQASRKGAGCDCLGLLRGVWRELFGDEPERVPPYAPDWSGHGDSLREALARHLDAVAPDAMAPGDVALFRVGRAARQCGIVGEKNGALTLIHAAQGRRVREEIFSPAWHRRLAVVFRIPF